MIRLPLCRGEAGCSLHPIFPCAARYARESTPDCKGPPRDGPHFPCPSSRCQTARSAASDRAARLVPAARLCVRVLSPFRFISAFSSSPPHLRSVLPLRRAEPVARRQRQVPPQNEGQAERREAQCLNVSRSYGATSRLRGVSRPAQPGRRLSALHRGVCRPGDPLRLRRCRRRRGEGSPPAIGHGGLRPGRFESAVTSRVRRHSPLRRQDRLRKTPLMSEDANPYHSFDM